MSLSSVWRSFIMHPLQFVMQNTWGDALLYGSTVHSEVIRFHLRETILCKNGCSWVLQSVNLIGRPVMSEFLDCDTALTNLTRDDLILHTYPTFQSLFLKLYIIAHSPLPFSEPAGHVWSWFSKLPVAATLWYHLISGWLRVLCWNMLYHWKLWLDNHQFIPTAFSLVGCLFPLCLPHKCSQVPNVSCFLLSLFSSSPSVWCHEQSILWQHPGKNNCTSFFTSLTYMTQCSSVFNNCSGTWMNSSRLQVRKAVQASWCLHYQVSWVEANGLVKCRPIFEP